MSETRGNPAHAAPGAAGGRRAFHAPRITAVYGFILAGVLAVAGFFILLVAGPASLDAYMVGWFVMACAAGAVIMAYRRATDRRPRLVLDDDGLWFRDWDLGAVRWDEIADASSRGSRLLGHVRVTLADAEAVLARVPGGKPATATAARLVRPPELLIPNGSLDAPPAEVLTAIRARLPGPAQSTADDTDPA